MRMISLATLFLLVIAIPARADSGLVLTVRVEEQAVPFSGKVTFLVAFENRSTEPKSYLEPLFAGMLTFPSIRLVSLTTGKTYQPYDAPFQSMAQPGLAGKVIELAPGRKKEYRLVRDRFGLVDPKTGRADWKAKAPLPPGRYRIEAEYEMVDDKAWFNTGGQRAELRRLEGIFTGKLTAEPVAFTVASPDRPCILITPPAEGRAEVVLTFLNPTTREHVFAGHPTLVLSSKAYGTGVAHPAVVRDGDVNEGARLEIRVPAGEKKGFRVRLRALSFSDRDAGPFGLGEVIPEGLAHAAFSLADAETGRKESTDGIYIRIPRPAYRGIENVKVIATLPEPEVSAGDPVTLTVELVNGSSEDMALLHGLSFPRDVLIRIEDADGIRPSNSSVTRTAKGLDALRSAGEGECRVAKGLSWNGDAFERPGPIKQNDLIFIEPGDGIQDSFDLGKLLATKLTPGHYRIFAGYRNYESGERFGWPLKRWAPVGIRWSKPVRLVVR